MIADGEVLPAGLVAERAVESDFADAARAYDQHSVARPDPCTEGHLEKTARDRVRGRRGNRCPRRGQMAQARSWSGAQTSSDGAAPSAGWVKMVSLDAG